MRNTGKSIGNFCTATWMIFWNQSDLKTSNVLVVVNSPSMNLNSSSSALTNIVSKMFAGICILDLFQNSSLAYCNHRAP
ncbi:hypothetical protein DL765_006199 [Monosporascus sp. GIB2]|nr:hypothetical protein DL765_006199 [Monosporascus sp. GIB2]